MGTGACAAVACDATNVATKCTTAITPVCDVSATDISANACVACSNSATAVTAGDSTV